jgi:hypothetical protein
MEKGYDAENHYDGCDTNQPPAVENTPLESASYCGNDRNDDHEDSDSYDEQCWYGHDADDISGLRAIKKRMEETSWLMPGGFPLCQA